MAELLPDLPAEFEIEGTMPGADYIATLQLMVQMLKLMHGGYNSQLQAETDAAATYQQCLQALQDTLEAANSHLPLQTGQKNKVLKSTGMSGTSFWGGEWEFKTASFSLSQLDNIITLATVTPIDITLVTPEIVGMHVLIHNSLQSTETVIVLNPNATIVGKYETWQPGENVIISPGDTFQAFYTDITPSAEVLEIF